MKGLSRWNSVAYSHASLTSIAVFGSETIASTGVEQPGVVESNPRLIRGNDGGFYFRRLGRRGLPRVVLANRGRNVSDRRVSCEQRLDQLVHRLELRFRVAEPPASPMGDEAMILDLFGLRPLHHRKLQQELLDGRLCPQFLLHLVEFGEGIRPHRVPPCDKCCRFGCP